MTSPETQAGRGWGDCAGGSIIKDLRAISLDLRPTMLDDLGLKPTLEWFARQFANRHEIPVDIDCQLGPGDNPDPEVATTTYRIIQEALGNVAKHARAAKVRIAVSRKASHLYIEVADDGKGFSPGGLQSRQVARGCSGLLNMKERARFLGGDFTLDSSPGEGTRLRVSIPLPEKGRSND